MQLIGFLRSQVNQTYASPKHHPAPCLSRGPAADPQGTFALFDPRTRRRCGGL